MPTIATGTPTISGGSIAPTQEKLWPFKVNWDEQVSEQIEFRTDVFETRSGREQRRAIRLKPRYKYEVSTWAAGEKQQRLTRLIRGRGGNEFVFRHPVDWIELDSTASSGVNLLTLADAPPYWVIENSYLMLDDGTDQEICRVLQTDINSIYINGVLKNEWPAGTKIRRAFAGRLDQPFNFDALTNRVGAFKITVAVDPQSNYEDDIGSAAVTFDSRELFLAKPNWSQPLNFDFDFGRETIDYGQGRVKHGLPKNTYKVLRKATFLGRSRAEITDLVQMFLRMKGQRGEFYAPSLTDDITAASISGGSVYVDGHELYRAMKDDLTNMALFARKSDGSYLVSKVSAVARNMGQTQLTLTTSWGTVAVNTVKSISVMSLWRFATDVLTVDWINSNTANIVMSFRSLENQASE